MIHGWLGVEGTDLTSEQAKALRGVGGALVHTVAPGSPAATAGLAADDVITEVGGREVRSISGLVVELRRHDPGEQVVVGYWRDGQHGDATVTLGEHP
jgi:serine protease Do